MTMSSPNNDNENIRRWDGGYTVRRSTSSAEPAHLRRREIFRHVTSLVLCTSAATARDCDGINDSRTPVVYDPSRSRG